MAIALDGAPNLTTVDRFVLGLTTVLVSPRRIPKLSAILKLTTLLKFHKALVDRKYRLLFSSSSRRRKPGRVSPRTVGKYMPKRCPSKPRGDQRWATFLRNHAKAIITCDFFATATVTFRLLYVFVVIHHGSRRLLHFNLTPHPTAAWTLRQLREIIGFGDAYGYLIHDRDSIFAKSLDESIARLGMTVLKSPFQSPKANAICERVMGTIRRECLDWLIPISETHLRLLLKERASHYNRSRPHMALGPGVPDPPPATLRPSTPPSRHRIGEELAVRAKSILGGLHHDHYLAPTSA